MKVFQLLGARHTLGIGVREIGGYLGVSRTKISNIEKQNLHSELNIAPEQIYLLTRLFNDKGIVFPNHHTIDFRSPTKQNGFGLSRFQLRVGRTILRLSQKEVANALKVKSSTISYLEGFDNYTIINDLDKCPLKEI